MLLYLVAVIGVALIFQHYLKSYYYDNLMKSQKSIENSILSSAQALLSIQMKDYINIGATMATSEDVFDAVEEHEEENSSHAKSQLRALLSSYTRNFNKLYSMAVINKDGLVYQGVTYRSVSSEIWREEDHDYLSEQYEKVMNRIALKEFPRCVVSMRKEKYEGHPEAFSIFYPMIGSRRKLADADHVLCLTFEADILEQYTNYILSCDIPYLVGFVSDEEGNIISHTQRDKLWLDENSYVSLENLQNISVDIPDMGWKLNVAYDDGAVKDYIDSIFDKAMPLYGVLILLLSLIIFVDIREILKPVNRIKSTMQYITNEGRHIPIKIEGENEVWSLAGAYNDMLVALDQKDKEVEFNHQQAVQSIERQHDAERAALETQISAHFICNTLNTINYEAIEEGNHKVAALIKKLSNILRYSFDQKSQYVYFYQEFAWIEQYLFLMKARLEDTFDYQVDVDDDIMDWKCCKLMLQPFVENAVIHGFRGRESGGILRITGRKREDRIEVRISDNGNGMPREIAENIEKVLSNDEIDTNEIGIGIRNAYARIRLYYGDKVKVAFQTKEGEGTEFTFELPIPEGKLY